MVNDNVDTNTTRDSIIENTLCDIDCFTLQNYKIIET